MCNVYVYIYIYIYMYMLMRGRPATASRAGRASGRPAPADPRGGATPVHGRIAIIVIIAITAFNCYYTSHSNYTLLSLYGFLDFGLRVSRAAGDSAPNRTPVVTPGLHNKIPA